MQKLKSHQCTAHTSSKEIAWPSWLGVCPRPLNFAHILTSLKRLKLSWRWKTRWDQYPSTSPASLGPQFQKPNPTIRRGDSTEKRRRASPKKRFRPATPKWPWCTLPYCKLQPSPGLLQHHPPFPQTTPKPPNGADDVVTVREDSPWPDAGKMSGNLFEERNWVLPKDYLAIEGKKEDNTVAKPPPKE